MAEEKEHNHRPDNQMGRVFPYPPFVDGHQDQAGAETQHTQDHQERTEPPVSFYGLDPGLPPFPAPSDGKTPRGVVHKGQCQQGIEGTVEKLADIYEEVKRHSNMLMSKKPVSRSRLWEGEKAAPAGDESQISWKRYG